MPRIKKVMVQHGLLILINDVMLEFDLTPYEIEIEMLREVAENLFQRLKYQKKTMTTAGCIVS